MQRSSSEIEKCGTNATPSESLMRKKNKKNNQYWNISSIVERDATIKRPSRRLALFLFSECRDLREWGSLKSARERPRAALNTPQFKVPSKRHSITFQPKWHTRSALAEKRPQRFPTRNRSTDLWGGNRALLPIRHRSLCRRPLIASVPTS